MVSLKGEVEAAAKRALGQQRHSPSQVPNATPASPDRAPASAAPPAAAPTKAVWLPSTISLNVRLDLDPAEIERFCPAADLDYFLRQSEDDHVIAQIRVDTATGTGVHLRWSYDGTSSIVPKHLDRWSTNGAAVLSRATASIMPVQHILELALLPFGVRFEAPTTDYHHRCDLSGHLPPSDEGAAPAPRCAMRFPDGISAKLNLASEYAPEESHALTSTELSSSLWDLLKSARGPADYSLTVFGVRLDMQDAGPRKAASWWSEAPQADPPPVDAEEMEAANSSETTTLFRSALMRPTYYPCAATGRQIGRHEAQTRTKLDAVHCVEASVGNKVYNRLVRHVYDNHDTEHWTSKHQCRPLFIRTQASSVGTLNSGHANGVMLSTMAGEAFLHDTIWILNGDVFVAGIPADWPETACFKPHSPSQAFHDLEGEKEDIDRAAEELEKLLQSTDLRPRQSKVSAFKYGCLHLKAALSFHNLFVKENYHAVVVLKLFAHSAHLTLLRRHQEAEAERGRRGLAETELQAPLLAANVVTVGAEGVPEQIHDELGEEVDGAPQDQAVPGGHVAGPAPQSSQSDESMSEESSAIDSQDSHGRYHDEMEEDGSCYDSHDSHGSGGWVSASQELAGQIEHEEGKERDRILHSRWFYWTLGNVFDARQG